MQVKQAIARMLGFKSFSFIRGDDGSTGGSRSVNLRYITGTDRDARQNSIMGSISSWSSRNIHQAKPEVWTLGKEPEISPEHPLAWIVRNPQANVLESERSAINGRLLLSALDDSLLYTGNSYALKVRNGSGKMIGLDYIPPHCIKPIARMGNPGVLDYYEVQTQRGVEKYMPSDIWHHRESVDRNNPLRGESKLVSLMRQILTDNEIAVYSHAIMRSPSPRLMVSPKSDDNPPNQADADYLAAKMEEKSSGESAGGVIVPTFAADVTPFAFTPDQMAIDIIQKLPEERICAVFGIPPVVLQLGTGLANSTYSNMKEAREAATEEYLVPKWDALASSINDQMLAEFADPRKFEFRYNYSGVRALQEDENKLHERVGSDFEKNMINLAEARAKLGYEPQPGDDKIWAWMLRQAQPIPGQQPAKAAADDRKKAEGS